MSQNITIAVRIRPSTQREQGTKMITSVSSNPPSLHLSSTKGLAAKQYQFPLLYASYGPNGVKNAQIYKEIGVPIMSNIFEGYNSTLFAYGQTGSGKTYTIEGQDAELGLLQMCVKGVMDRKSEKVEVWVSYLEIYNEELRDLLDVRKKTLKIFSSGEGVVVQNLSKVYCDSEQDVMKLVHEGKKIRVVGSHAMNSKSSRSHAIFMMLVVQKDDKAVKVAQLNIVDLAGSERHSKTQSDEYANNAGSACRRPPTSTSR